MESEKVWKIKNIIYKIFHPRVWVTVNRYSSYEYEKAIRESVKNQTLAKICLPLSGAELYRAIDTVTGQETWISNYPYAFGHAYTDTYNPDERLPGISERYSKNLWQYLKTAPVIYYDDYKKLKNETN